MESEEQDKPNYYAILPASVRYDKRLKPAAKILYAEIAALSNKHGYCWAGNSYFSDLFEVSKSTISRWIAELSEYGYINISMSYKTESKEIEVRKLYIISPIEQKDQGGIDEKINGYTQKDQGGIRKKRKDNITSNNNKYNIINTNNITQDDELDIHMDTDLDYSLTTTKEKDLPNGKAIAKKNNWYREKDNGEAFRFVQEGVLIENPNIKLDNIEKGCIKAVVNHFRTKDGLFDGDRYLAHWETYTDDKFWLDKGCKSVQSFWKHLNRIPAGTK